MTILFMPLRVALETLLNLIIKPRWSREVNMPGFVLRSILINR
ncbi:hypothetical protein LINGRAHAP2_LOCUS11481 [Linum grandiflorum]